MTKETLVAQLEAAKGLTSVVSIDNVIALIAALEIEPVVIKQFGLTQELADKITGEIATCLDNNCDRLVDLDSVELEMSYNNQIEVTGANIEVSSVMRHVESLIDAYVLAEDEVIEDTEE
jgi:hypothetical protein